MVELDQFVRDALAAGKSRDEVRDALLTAGWQRGEVEIAVAHYADIPFPVPVPIRRV